MRITITGHLNEREGPGQVVTVVWNDGQLAGDQAALDRFDLLRGDLANGSRTVMLHPGERWAGPRVLQDPYGFLAMVAEIIFPTLQADSIPDLPERYPLPPGAID